MGALCQWTGGADKSMGGIWRTDAPPLQGEEIRHAFPDGGDRKKKRFVCYAYKSGSSSFTSIFSSHFVHEAFLH